MPLEWKTTTIHRLFRDDVEITHWKQHDPKKLLEAINSKPLRTVEGIPKVRVYPFGPHELAVREMGPYPQWKYFDFLRQTAERKAAVVEMPVAKISRRGKKDLVVTLWKKGTRPLGDFLEDTRVPVSLRRKAALKAMRVTAMLHDAGFIHGHIGTSNFVVDKQGIPAMVDYTWLHPAKVLVDKSQAELMATEAPALYKSEAELMATYLAYNLRATHPAPSHAYEKERMDRLIQKLVAAYERYRKK